jgi:haloacetate dehalogenase
MTVPLPALFSRVALAPGGVRINTLVGGNSKGSPVLLLHGYPQTHVMWHHVAPILAQHHTVVLTDLRGYGDSGKPPGGSTHDGYAKRTMARDQVLVMRELGYDSFAVIGHDRGARVSHRMALDYPQAVTRLAVLDIIPTRHAFRNADMRFGLGYWHWFFLAQPEPLPEHQIGADPAGWVRGRMSSGRRGQRVTMPLLALWGEHSFVGRHYGDVLTVWREYATEVAGRSLPCGHYLAEEVPLETAAALLDFLRA